MERNSLSYFPKRELVLFLIPCVLMIRPALVSPCPTSCSPVTRGQRLEASQGCPRRETVEAERGQEDGPCSEVAENMVLGHSSETPTVTQGWNVSWGLTVKNT